MKPTEMDLHSGPRLTLSRVSLTIKHQSRLSRMPRSLSLSLSFFQDVFQATSLSIWGNRWRGSHGDEQTAIGG